MTERKPGLLVCRSQRPAAAIRLYCFAHSGGSPGEFVRWADHLPLAEVWGVQLPGRGSRISEPAHTRFAPAVNELVAHGGFHDRFAFFGHSLGALLAFETARALRDMGLLQPERLYLSACPAPELFRALPAVHHLDDHDLFEAIQGRYASLPPEIAKDEEMLALVMATHRADFELAHHYAYVAGPPLRMPLHVLGGTDDNIPPESLDRWRTHSTGPLDLRMFPGDHFYLRDPATALHYLKQTLVGPVPDHCGLTSSRAHPASATSKGTSR